jgi:hypothetical protein
MIRTKPFCVIARPAVHDLGVDPTTNALVVDVIAVQQRNQDSDVQQSFQPINTANRGLITSSMIARRSSKWMNADFIALTVNRSRSLQP